MPASITSRSKLEIPYSRTPPIIPSLLSLLSGDVSFSPPSHFTTLCNRVASASIFSSNAVLQIEGIREHQTVYRFLDRCDLQGCTAFPQNSHRLANTKMASPDPMQVMQQHVQLERELREIKEEFDRREQHELAVFEETRRTIEAKWQEDRNSLSSQTQMPLSESLERFLIDAKSALLKGKEEEYRRGKAEREKRFEEDQRRHSDKWRMLFAPSTVSLPFRRKTKSLSQFRRD